MPSTLPYLAVFLFVLAFYVIIAVLGISRARKVDQFYVMERRAPWLFVAATMSTTWLSLWTYMGGLGSTWNWGFPAVATWFIGSAWGCYFACHYLCPPLRKGGFMTVADFMGDRYASPRVRGLAAFNISVALIFYLLIQIMGLGMILEILAGIPYVVSATLIISILVLTVMLGGQWSVVLSDLLSFTIMVLAAIVAILCVHFFIIPIPEAIATSAAKYPDLWKAWPTIGRMKFDYFWLASYIVSWFVLVGGSAHMINRAFIAKDIKTVYKGYGAGLTISVFIVLLLYVTFSSYVAVVPYEAMNEFPVKSSDYLVPWTIWQHWPIIAAVIFYAGMTLAGTTTAIGQLITMSTAFGREFWARGIRGGTIEEGGKATDKEIMLVTRIAVIVLAAISLGLAATRPWIIIIASSLAGALLAAAFFPTLVLGIYWKRFTRKAAELTLIIGFIFGVFSILTWHFLKWFAPFPTLYNIAVGFGVAILAGILTKPSSNEKYVTEKVFQTIHKPEKLEVTRKDYIDLAIIALVLFGAALLLSYWMATALP
ncbi:MAG: sodium:solute symporter family protein [Archaeoglobaceae archaeon]|nr:sodium:solute symporter family protein [Archaeoglobales archaeon]